VATWRLYQVSARRLASEPEGLAGPANRMTATPHPPVPDISTVGASRLGLLERIPPSAPTFARVCELRFGEPTGGTTLLRYLRGIQHGSGKHSLRTR
jgi:hypothetical protein